MNDYVKKSIHLNGHAGPTVEWVILLHNINYSYSKRSSFATLAIRPAGTGSVLQLHVAAGSGYTIERLNIASYSYGYKSGVVINYISIGNDKKEHVMWTLKRLNSDLFP